MENFKISLKAARVNAEMTQEEVANLMGKNKGSPSVKDPRYAVQNPKKAGRR